MKLTVREVIVEKYGSISVFVDELTKENKGNKLPISRPYLYKLINHKIKNPGIKTLNVLSKITGIKKELIYEEYSK